MTGHLVGVSEIAALLGISRQRADQLSHAEEFPAPEAVLASGRVWRRADVERWAKRVGRLPLPKPGGPSVER